MAQDQAASGGFIGVDVGGTHTDVAVLLDGRVERGKALTTYDDFSRGVLEAVGVAAGRFGLSLGELLARTDLFVNGTTVVTNTITELRGCSVGLLVTSGFRDVLRFAGGPRLSVLDDHLQVNVPDLVARSAIAEIEERIDWSGEELVPLNEEQTVAELRRLVEEEKVEALAICFLHSYANEAHERRVVELARGLYPDLFISASHVVYPVAGETRRFTTTVLNSFVHRDAQVYLDSLGEQLRTSGLAGGLMFFQGLGGGISLNRARTNPLALLGSGPAAGAIGANELAKRMGEPRVLLGDMGGTSFDTGIIVDNEVKVAKNLDIDLFQTGVNIVDVISVGAGGGSIASIGERGVPQVGPRSASSTPGPAALGRGGTEPTVTDAMVVLGFIDPARYLDGRVPLYPEKSAEALENVYAEPFGWTAVEAACAVHDLAVVNMATAVREVSVNRGHDPREFLFLAYGGTLPMFAGQIARRLGIRRVVMPANSSVFCARGLLSADFVVRRDQAARWDLSQTDGVESVNLIVKRLLFDSRAALTEEGFSEEQIEQRVTADLRYRGQSFELSIVLPDRALTESDATDIAAQFATTYEETYGSGTAWKDVPVVMVNVSVTAVGSFPRPPEQGPVTGDALESAELGRRLICLPETRERVEVAIYAASRLEPGMAVSGPTIIDAGDTTIYVPVDCELRLDQYGNFVMEVF
ncbi:hydantoinase/oxoprolinase family protein [Arthrobacter sp. UNC362MFTsu5.1]|uniref:hydantoinase/oxoprolinase family protein n=1 Tax=Arthrobacter sp. UNC362MFTsu5.1 TaxID=1449044 RepID=UPI000489305B|nr:hydantoinase/oxoprolinase family protein [Arthrobacter sp. UNC362MFTsu5.1]